MSENLDYIQLPPMKKRYTDRCGVNDLGIFEVAERIKGKSKGRID